METKKKKNLALSVLIAGGAMAFALPNEANATAQALRWVAIDHGGNIVGCKFEGGNCLPTIIIVAS